MAGEQRIPLLSRAEVVSIMFRLGLFGVVTYFTFKWVVDLMDPTRKQKQQAKHQAEQLMKKIGVECQKLTEYEMCIASQLIDTLSLTVDWKDIGGLENVIDEIQETVILPMKRKDLFNNSKLLQPPKGVLLHGPPGCGKTMISKAIAKAAGARFINLQMSSLTDKWYGESQKLASAVFSLAYKLQPSIIFVDEIDSFLRSRDSQDHECTAMMKAQFMSLWDGLLTDPSAQITLIGATNRPQDVDKAIVRRMPAMFYVGLPSADARKHILGIILKKERVSGDLNMEEIASQTSGFSGSDLTEACRVAAMYSVKDYVKSQKSNDSASADEGLRSISQQDLKTAVSKIKQGKSFHLLQPSAPILD